MTDLIKELRENADIAHAVTGCSLRNHLCTKAADEIERLRAGEWIACTSKMPDQDDDAKGNTKVVIGYNPSVEDGFISMDLVNAVFFNEHWKARGYTYWMYAPQKPTVDQIKGMICQ